MSERVTIDRGEAVDFGTAAELYAWLKAHSPGTLILEGMDSAILGILPVSPGLYALAYDYRVVLEVLQRDLQISYGDAVVYFQERLLPLYENHENPVFVEALPGVMVPGGDADGPASSEK